MKSSETSLSTSFISWRVAETKAPENYLKKKSISRSPTTTCPKTEINEKLSDAVIGLSVTKDKSTWTETKKKHNIQSKNYIKNNNNNIDSMRRQTVQNFIDWWEAIEHLSKPLTVQQVETLTSKNWRQAKLFTRWPDTSLTITTMPKIEGIKFRLK